MKSHVFICTKWSGVPEESEEMLPEWFSLDEMPVSNMLWDFQVWLSPFIKGEKSKGEFLLGEKFEVVDYSLE